MVLVVEHVAVDDVLAGVVAEAAGDQQLVAGVHEEGLLQAAPPTAAGGLPLRREQVPVGVVDVEQVGDVRLVDELPGLDRAELRRGARRRRGRRCGR